MTRLLPPLSVSYTLALCSRQMGYLPFILLSAFIFPDSVPFTYCSHREGCASAPSSQPTKLLLILQGQLRCHCGERSCLIKSVTIESFCLYLSSSSLPCRYLFKYSSLALLEPSFTQVCNPNSYP